MTATQLIRQPAVLSPDGTIRVHGRGSLTLGVELHGEGSLPIDIEQSNLYFEIQGGQTYELQPGDEPTVRLLVLDNDAVAAIPTWPGVQYVLVDDTGDVPVTVWEGMIYRAGFLEEPGLAPPGGNPLPGAPTMFVVVRDGSPNKVVISLRGATGSAGAGGATYVHTQSSPSALWTVNHNLGRYPSSVRLTDMTGSEFFADVQDVSPNQLTVTLSSPSAGRARIV